MDRHRDIRLPESNFTVVQARVPSCFLARLPDGVREDDESCALLDIVVERGRIAALRPGGTAEEGTPPRIDIRGRQVWATLIDMHAHLDKGQLIPRARPDGTLEGGLRLSAQDRKFWTEDDIAARMRFGLKCAYVHGVAAIRTHLDSHEELAERSWSVFEQLRAEWRDRVTLQAVGLVPLAAFRTSWGTKLADLVAESGGVLGCVTDGLGAYEGAMGEVLDDLLDRFLRVAAERGLDVDLHVDQSDDLNAFALPHIAKAVLRRKFQGRVVCGHCVNLALQPDEVAKRAIALAQDAGLAFVTLPTAMMYLQDRRPGRTPRWRGVTLAAELGQAGLAVAVGGDNCRDAWFPFGDHDILDTVQQAVRVFQLDDPVAAAVAMAGPIPSDTIRGGTLGRLVEGGPADFILLSARSLNEAMCRPQSNRIVVRQGRQLTEQLPDYEELDATLNRGS
jgi:cytosine/creatinine deaminase